MLHHSRSARRALVALTAVSLTLAACGGGDDDEGDAVASATTESAATTPSTTTATSESPATTAAAAEETATTAASGDATATTAAETSDDDTIIVESFDDMPAECRELLTDFLKTIEPAVAEVDWNSATLGDFQSISEGLAGEFESMDQRVTETGCDAYDFAEDADSIAPMIQLAEEEAPGTVGWLQFLATLDDEPVVNADLPKDCDAAIAYIDEIVAGGGTMNDIAITQMTDVGQVLNVISTECDPAVVSEFYARPEITAFLG